MSKLHLISSLSTKSSEWSQQPNVYHTPVTLDESAEWWATRDVYKHRWQHAMQMYTDWGVPGVVQQEPEGSAVYAMQNKWYDITPYRELDTSYDVIYVIHNPNRDIKNITHEEYVTNWPIFCRMNLYWRSIQNSMPVLAKVDHENKVEPDFQFKYWAASMGVRIVVV